jgi:dihydrofolate reductase
MEVGLLAEGAGGSDGAEDPHGSGRRTEHGLIDEYQFAVAPVMLGQGRHLISGVTRTSKMSLTESRALPQGNLLLRYEPAD